MKHLKHTLVVSAALFGSIVGLTSCGGDGSELGAAVKSVVEQAEKMSREDLFQKAADELGGNTMKFIGTSSRFKKAIEPFIAELTKYNSACAGASVTTDTAVDGQIYTKLLGEIESGITDGYSAALVQDGFQLQKKGLDTGYFINYVPKERAEATDTDKELNKDPFALQYNFKTRMINNANGNSAVIDNVWDITTDAYKGKLVTMDPNNENVNMDWLIMLTQDKWCDALKNAFEDASNDNKTLDVSKYATYGEKKQYAYAFIDRFITNASFYGDDGQARDQMSSSSAAGTAGWIVYSKIASIQETADVSKKNFTIAALGKDNSDGANATMHMKGFGGFMYKHYLQIMPNAKYPRTACAFINYLSTTKEGYAGWASDIGDYPSMPSINVDRTKNGHGTLDENYVFTQDPNGENVFPALNDPASTWWTSETGGNVVIEDPSYIATQYYAVNSFISSVIANK
jgi:hypothetical protein